LRGLQLYKTYCCCPQPEKDSATAALNPFESGFSYRQALNNKRETSLQNEGTNPLTGEKEFD